MQLDGFPHPGSEFNNLVPIPRPTTHRCSRSLGLLPASPGMCLRFRRGQLVLHAGFRGEAILTARHLNGGGGTRRHPHKETLQRECTMCGEGDARCSDACSLGRNIPKPFINNTVALRCLPLPSLVRRICYHFERRMLNKHQCP